MNAICFLAPAHKGWGYSHPLRRPDGRGGGTRIKLVGVPQPKLALHGFHQIFR